MRRQLVILAAFAALAAGAVAAAMLLATGSRADVPASAGAAGAPRSTFSRTEARGFTEFPLYDLGDSFEGLPLTAVLRRRDKPYPGEPIRPNNVAFIYGDCQAGNDSGCAPPLEVKTWPACVRNPSVYDIPGGADERATVRGVPARFYERWTRLELSTGRVTVVLYGTGRRDLLRAAARLRGVNVPHAAEAKLPPPARGAMTGELRCGA